MISILKCTKLPYIADRARCAARPLILIARTSVALLKGLPKVVHCPHFHTLHRGCRAGDALGDLSPLKEEVAANTGLEQVYQGPIRCIPIQKLAQVSKSPQRNLLRTSDDLSNVLSNLLFRGGDQLSKLREGGECVDERKEVLVCLGGGRTRCGRSFLP